MERPLLVLVGPTGVGKTALAVRLSERLGAEVVSADSRQVYRYLDIGTAKPTADERRRAPHHLLDVVNPDQTMTLAEYQEMAYAAIDDVQSRGRLPLLVGGTGLYVTAVVEGWRMPRVAPDEDLRQTLLQRAEREGATALHAELARVDPMAAARIDERNVRRVIRALEVYLRTGRPFSSQRGQQRPPYRVLWLGLTMPRPALYERVDARIDRMLAEGWIAEVRDLLDRGFSGNEPAFSALGYREVVAHIRGELQLEAAVALIRRHTRRFIRHQGAWFRADDERIHWFDATQPHYEAIEALVTSALAGQEVQCRRHAG
ncbi:MAG: tRNA (adenosine(37)-N6)-dimethylallyltransferase MiaA [Anaerolineae bacterium]